MIWLVVIILLMSQKIPAKLTHIPPSDQWVVSVNSFLSSYLEEREINVLVGEMFQPQTPCWRFNYTILKQFLTGYEFVPHTLVMVDYYLEILPEFLQETLELYGKSRYIVVVENAKALKVAQLLWKFKLPKSLVITSGLMTVNLLTISQCGNVVSLTDVTNVTDAWDLKSQMAGCSLNIIWAKVPPYISDVDSPMPGIYVDFLRAFDSAINRRLIYRPYDPVYLQQITDGYSFEAILEAFDDDYADMFIGPGTLTVSSIMDVTPILNEIDILFFVPIPTVAFWQKVVTLAFVLVIVVYAVAIVTVSVLFFYIAKQTEDRILYASVPRVLFLFYGFVLSVPNLRRSPSTIVLQMYLSKY